MGGQPCVSASLSSLVSRSHAKLGSHCWGNYKRDNTSFEKMLSLCFYFSFLRGKLKKKIKKIVIVTRELDSRNDMCGISLPSD